MLLYNRTTSDQASVNDARKQLFTEIMQMGKLTTNSTFTCTRYQTRNLSSKLLEKSLDPNLLSPIDWGWQPLWTNLPEASESCTVVVRKGVEGSASVGRLH